MILKQITSKKLNQALDFEPQIDISAFHVDKKHILYKLVGIINHSGSAQQGHYISYILDSNQKWFIFDDLNVSPVIDVTEVIRQNKGGTNSFSNGYVLFYRKINIPTYSNHLYEGNYPRHTL